MARHSSTSASRAFFLAACALLPLFLAEGFLVPALSGRAVEMRAIGFEEARPAAKRLLLLGDSTARRLHFWPPIPFTPSPRTSDDWLNFGLGGSSVVDWTLLCERAFAGQPGLEDVAVVASAGGYGSVTSVATAPYVAYLAGWKGAFRFLREGELRPGEAGVLIARGLFHVYSDRNDVLFSLLLPDPDLRPWADRLSFRARPGTPGGEDGAPTGPGWVSRWFEKLAVCAGRSGHRPLLVLSPLHSAERASGLHADRIAAYRAACGVPGVRCLDLEGAFPDADFLEDRVHLRPERQGELLRRVEVALKQP